jgi:hypothetical protein
VRSIKWLWLATWALLWAGMAGCTQDPSLQNAYPTEARSDPAQPAGIPTPATTQALAAPFVLPVKNRSFEMTPSPTTSELSLKERLVQSQKETVESATKDLAQRLGISVEDVAVLAVIGQEYSLDAFYCRTTKGRIARDEPTLLLNGETILLEARGSRYEYHATDQLVIYCRRLL